MFSKRAGAQRPGQGGSALLLATVMITMILGLLLAGITMVTAKSTEAAMATELLRAQAVADSGLEHATYWFREAMKIWGTCEAFDAMDPNPTEDILTGATQLIFAGPQDDQVAGVLRDTEGRVVGEYDVYIDVRDRSSEDHRTVVVRSCAYVPSKSAYLNGQKNAYMREVFSRLRLRQVDGKPGNYGYFINHWGWFYGSTITANGSVRANGYFSMRYNPTINGSPIFDSAEGFDLRDKENDGGVFAGLGIEGTCRGMGGLPENQYDYEYPVVMPNLSDLSYYRSKAQASGGSVTVGGIEYTGNGVYGDEGGEKENLYLEGTADDPIKIHGLVVVEGDLVIKGYVNGQGTIIAGGNVYIADDLVYLNPPATPRPSGTAEAEIEAWIRENMDKDFLGLYAREHIVVGNWSDRTWQSYVFSWLAHDMNRSDEDAGLDGIHHTGDEGEDDGEWTVERYTAAHEAMGLIPPGSRVGDIIPGSGEDIDGDGTFDGRISTHGGWLNEFKIDSNLNSSHWGGNLPDHGDNRQWRANWSDLATNNIDRLDGCFFTNHAFAGLILGSGTIQINGAIISRNESIVYWPRIDMNHDERLTGRSWEDLGLIGGGGKVWDDIVVEAYWTAEDSHGPNDT